MALVFQSRDGARTLYIDVTGSAVDGYRITRQVLDEGSELETIWVVPQGQAQTLRTALGDAVHDDLSATGSPDGYEPMLVRALDALGPSVTPFSWLSRD